MSPTGNSTQFEMSCHITRMQVLSLFKFLGIGLLEGRGCIERLLKISSCNETVIEVDLGIWGHSVGIPFTVHLPCLWLLKN